MPEKALKATGREALPGISAKFDPVSASKLWGFAIDRERAFLDKPISPKRARNKLGFGGPSFDDIMSSSVKGMLVPEESHSLKTLAPIASSQGDTACSSKKDWESRYRFFGIPFNSEKTPCHQFEGERMRRLFTQRQEALHTSKQSGFNELTEEEVETNLLKTCEAAQESLTNARTEARGSVYSGYKWPRYKYFGSGCRFPSSGVLDPLIEKRFMASPRESFLKGTRPLPILRPSQIRP